MVVVSKVDRLHIKEQKEYPKPDVHMIDIFKSINYCGTDQISCYKAMVKTAEECSVDAYALDKVLWLMRKAHLN